MEEDIVYNKLLARQIRKFLPEGAGHDEKLGRFLMAINDSFNAFERDKRLSEHAFRVSEKDYLEIYKQLKEEINVRKISIEKLKETIRNIEPDSVEMISPGEQNLLEIVDYLYAQINKRKEAEAALLIAKEEAEKAKEEAEKANIAKSEFLSVMSHEIRTPLNAVIGLGHILLRQNPRPDQVKNLHVLRTSADNLLTLINDILDFSKIGAGKLELDNTPFEIRKFIHDLHQTMTIKAQERSNTISMEIDPEIPEWVYGDQHRLMQVMNNLLSNAVKFTKQGEVNIALQLKSKSATRCAIQFSITDTGIGVEESKLEHIFKPFSQASSSTTREFGGTGLGLAITAELLQLMKSRIHLETAVGQGSCFYFTLELDYISSENQHAIHLSPQQQDLKNAKILLVEDTPFNVIFAIQLLEGWNASVDVAENGAIAVEKMQLHHYDLVLMDLQMPVMDGYTSSRKIREFNQATPIIALTASASIDIREKITAAGMQDYVTKPFNPDDLFYRIRNRIQQ